jgi:predicted kinase
VESRRLYLVGGTPRVGKSSLARRLLREGVAWLPIDVIRTVLRRVLPDLDTLDHGLVDATLVAEFMYPHIEQAAEVCAEEHDAFVIEGFDLEPSFRARLARTLAPTVVRACFLGHETFTSADLADYRGPKPQHEDTMTDAELDAAAAWIRHRSEQLRARCTEADVPYVDVGELGFDTAMDEATRHLLG